ncbi:hypothetical protein AB1L42_19580 [Thalassoglobus sp. JC818]|uniref:hypothetical protein n=1 Tax=Thalassoglobus sp. JC818 TaxID=3232136 RepID=UPI00345B34BF
MKTLGILILSGTVFAATCAGSWWAKNRFLSSEQASDQTANNNDVLGTLHPPNDDDQSDGGVEEMPVPVRPKEVSVEELIRLSMSLKEREKQIIGEEKRIQDRVIQQQIAFNDMLNEREEMDQLRKRTSEQIRSAEQLISQLIQARQSIIDERATTETKLKEMQEASKDIDLQTRENTRRLSQWIESMDSEKSADVIREMANDGKMAIAVEILSNIEERDAAKILSSINDSKLVQDLVQEFRNLKTSTKSTDRKTLSR